MFLCCRVRHYVRYVLCPGARRFCAYVFLDLGSGTSLWDVDRGQRDVGRGTSGIIYRRPALREQRRQQGPTHMPHALVDGTGPSLSAPRAPTPPPRHHSIRARPTCTQMPAWYSARETAEHRGLQRLGRGTVELGLGARDHSLELVPRFMRTKGSRWYFGAVVPCAWADSSNAAPYRYTSLI